MLNDLHTYFWEILTWVSPLCYVPPSLIYITCPRFHYVAYLFIYFLIIISSICLEFVSLCLLGRRQTLGAEFFLTVQGDGRLFIGSAILWRGFLLEIFAIIFFLDKIIASDNLN